MPNFFIDRPIFASVIALIVSLAGVLALRELPVEQYPQIAPPSLSIFLNYPGASASAMEQNVTRIIEQKLSGVDGFLYMSSSSRSNGSAQIAVSFKPGTDINVAQTDIQNLLSSVEQRLPEAVRRLGFNVLRAGGGGNLMVVTVSSKSGKTDYLALGNYAATNIVDELRRVDGVGDVQVFGSGYAMRIWLNTEKLTAYRLSPSKVAAAIREQNIETAGGAIGDEPVTGETEIHATISTAQNRFSSVKEFENIILVANQDGSIVRLSDVARVELGAENYLYSGVLSGKPMVGMGIKLGTGANALKTAHGVRKRMEELSRSMPSDLDWTVPYDSTIFIERSISAVIQTLGEAMLLVVAVMFIFLQNWRSTAITAIVVPISLAGACLGLWLLGYTINVLSLFAMVLAIGILVDDAIVVIENVERIMHEEPDLSPVQATRKAMSQISGAIVGMTLVIIAVLLPMAFFPGSTGEIYRQFSITMTVSIFFSALMALIFSPALCATFLRSGSKTGSGHSGLDKFFQGFNNRLNRSIERYQRTTGRLLRFPRRWGLVYFVLVVLTAVVYLRLPGSFLPMEDPGVIMTVVQAPPGSTAHRTEEAIKKVEGYWGKKSEVALTFTLKGYSPFGEGQTAALMFAPLIDWKQRTASQSSAESLRKQAQDYFNTLKEAFVFSMIPPPITQLGNDNGFTFKLQDRGGRGREELREIRDELLSEGRQSPLLANLRANEVDDIPELEIDIDRDKVRSMGLSIGEVNAALEINFGSVYVNDFTWEGRVLRVYLQADAEHRMTPRDLLNTYVPNSGGEMVPFSAFASLKWTAGSPQLDTYNGYPSLTISGTPAPGVSSGEAMAEMEKFAADLPEGFGFEWTGMSYEQKQSAGQVGALLGLSILVVFLVLAALYESWSIPVAVLLIVPMGVLGAVLFSMLRGLSADIYFNVGLITIIGLAAKNAILVVEFALEQEKKLGISVYDATMNAIKLRLRPIIMTSLAFILGMVPLVLSNGAGAASRIAVGTGVMGGMILATALGIYFIPLLYLLVRSYLSKQKA